MYLQEPPRGDGASSSVNFPFLLLAIVEMGKTGLIVYVIFKSFWGAAPDPAGGLTAPPPPPDLQLDLATSNFSNNYKAG